MGIAYLIYKRLRAPLGIPFGFILMYGMYANNLNLTILIAALGFCLIELFGGFYNDYWDYEEDKRNERNDKFTTTGLLSRKKVGNVSYMIAFFGVVSLLFTNLPVLVLGLYYLFLFVAYSHPAIRLKGKLWGYFALASMFLFMPVTLDGLLGIHTSFFSLVFTLFFFTQFMYILCQKDSTDPKDDKNIFMQHGWNKSAMIATGFGALSSGFFMVLCLVNPVLLLVWGINMFVKFFNLYRILTRNITRSHRSKFILTEFVTPYLYVWVI